MLRRSAPTAGGHSRSSGWNRNTRKRSCGAPGCGASTFPSAAVSIARSGCRAGIRCKLPTPSGAAAVQVGPEAVTLGVLMNKAQGFPHADAAAILKQGFGLTMSRSGICRAIQRVARKAEATWHALRDAARDSTLAHMDETGWKVDAQLRWLWGVVTEQITYCEILPGRGFDQASSILGADYSGWLIQIGRASCRERG